MPRPAARGQVWPDRLLINEMSSSPDRDPPTLDDDAIEAVARRVAELLDARRAPASYLSTAAVAQMLDVSEEWVRDHAAEFGAVRLGDRGRGQLRFEHERVWRALDERRLEAAPRRRSPRRARPRAAGVRLLPLPEPGRSR